QVLFDDQEVSLPFRSARGNIAVRPKHDAGLAAERDLAGDILEGLRIDGHAEASREHLAIELRRRRVVDTPGYARDAIGRLLLCREVARETLKRDGVAESAAALHVKSNAVWLSGLEGFERYGNGLAGGRAGDVEHGELGVVECHRQAISVF